MLKFIPRPAISAGKGAHLMHKMLALLTMAGVSAMGWAQIQPQQVPKRKPAPIQLELKVGWAIGGEFPYPQITAPLVDPIEGATVVLVDKDALVIGVRTTDKQGLSYWPHQKEDFSASVAIIGRRVQTFHFEGGKKTASILIRLARTE